ETGVQWAAGAAAVLVVIAALLPSFGLKGAGRLLSSPGPEGGDPPRARGGSPRQSPRAPVESGPVRYLRGGLNERRLERAAVGAKGAQDHACQETGDSCAAASPGTCFCLLRASTRPTPV